VLDGDSAEPADLVADIERLVRAGDDVRVIVLLADNDHALIGVLLDAGLSRLSRRLAYTE